MPNNKNEDAKPPLGDTGEALNFLLIVSNRQM
jgi:hypothetical protein